MDKELLLKITGYDFDVTQIDTQDITKSIFQQALHMPTEEEKVKALEFALLARCSKEFFEHIKQLDEGARTQFLQKLGPDILQKFLLSEKRNRSS